MLSREKFLFAATLLLALNVFANERAAIVLDEVWGNVAQRHYNRNFKADKRHLYEKHKPLILQSKDDTQLANAINKLLAETGDSHITLLVPLRKSGQKALSRLKKAPVQKTGTPAADPGFTVLDTPDGLLAIHVSEELTRDKIILPGDRIVEIEGIKIDHTEKVRPSWGIICRALLMQGEADSTVSLTIQRNGLEYPRKVTRKAGKGAFFQLGAMPGMTASYCSELRSDNIGVVRFNVFENNNIQKFRHDVRNKLKDADALVIDLRGNPGGIVIYAEWLASWCTDKAVPMGEMVIDDTRLSTTSTPQPGAFSCPVAVLVDRDSCSTAELFAAAMQDAEAAVIIGEKTPGLCLPSVMLPLKSGFLLQTISGSISRPCGKNIEGIGVTPDHQIPLKAEDLQRGEDSQLDFAVRLLKEMAR